MSIAIINSVIRVHWSRLCRQWGYLLRQATKHMPTVTFVPILHYRFLPLDLYYGVTQTSCRARLFVDISHHKYFECKPTKSMLTCFFSREKVSFWSFILIHRDSYSKYHRGGKYERDESLTYSRSNKLKHPKWFRNLMDVSVDTDSGDCNNKTWNILRMEITFYPQSCEDE